MCFLSFFLKWKKQVGRENGDYREQSPRNDKKSIGGWKMAILLLGTEK